MEETQTYELKCSQCEKILGESSVEDRGGHLCAACDQENKLPEILAQGKTMDCPHLASERPERLQEIVKAALIENPETLLSLNFNEHVEQSKKEIETTIGLHDLELEQKVEVMQKIKEKGDIAQISDEELKNKIAEEKENLTVQAQDELK